MKALVHVEDKRMTSGSVIRYLRKARGWSQLRLATATRTWEYTICRWERDNVNITLERFIQTLNALGYEVHIRRRSRY